MNERLFEIEEYPEVPIFREPARRRSEGDARFKGEYPPEWKKCPRCEGRGLLAPDVPCPDCLGMGSLRGRVRREAGHRCLRCGHPYIPKRDALMIGAEPSWREGGWSACDGKCNHGGPMRVLDENGRRVASHDDAPADWHEHIVRAPDSGWRRETAWRILTVHHADGDKANVRWWNLLALCQVCHLTIQAKVVMERIYPHEHSDWFKPFVAGYYAWVYNGEELTREQVEERMPELLALEQGS